MIKNQTLFRHYLISQRCLRQCSTKIDLEKLEQENTISVEVFDENSQKREEEIERKRNKSRLSNPHRNIVHDIKPYNEDMFWTHSTLKYNRKLYGKYGQASGINPAICWPTKQELNDIAEYEKVAYPFTVMEMIEKAHKDRRDKEERIAKRQQEIVEKMAKLEIWKKELFDKIKKKEAEELAAKERKDRLIEEVRRHFGYLVDPRDEKFKEMVEKKEKEQKKMMKEAKRKAKEEKMLAKLMKKTDEGGTSEETVKSDTSEDTVK